MGLALVFVTDGTSRKMRGMPGPGPAGQNHHTPHRGPWGGPVACPFCGAQERRLEGLQTHMEGEQGDHQVSRQIQRCKAARNLACLALLPLAWPYGWQGGKDSPVVDRLMATLQENGMKPANPAAFACPLDTTMDTSMSTTMDETLNHGVVRSVVAVSTTTSSLSEGINRMSSPWRRCEPINRMSSPWRRCEPCPVLGEPVSCSSPTSPDEDPPAKKEAGGTACLRNSKTCEICGGYGWPRFSGLGAATCNVGSAARCNSRSRVGWVILQRRYPGGFMRCYPMACTLTCCLHSGTGQQGRWRFQSLLERKESLQCPPPPPPQAGKPWHRTRGWKPTSMSSLYHS